MYCYGGMGMRRVFMLGGCRIGFPDRVTESIPSLYKKQKLQEDIERD
jgi:hypothetical protein